MLILKLKNQKLFLQEETSQLKDTKQILVFSKDLFLRLEDHYSKEELLHSNNLSLTTSLRTLMFILQQELSENQ